MTPAASMRYAVDPLICFRLTPLQRRIADSKERARIAAEAAQQPQVAEVSMPALTPLPAHPMQVEDQRPIVFGRRKYRKPRNRGTLTKHVSCILALSRRCR